MSEVREKKKNAITLFKQNKEKQKGRVVAFDNESSFHIGQLDKRRSFALSSVFFECLLWESLLLLLLLLQLLLLLLLLLLFIYVVFLFYLYISFF